MYNLGVVSDYNTIYDKCVSNNEKLIIDDNDHISSKSSSTLELIVTSIPDDKYINCSLSKNSLFFHILNTTYLTDDNKFGSLNYLSYYDAQFVELKKELYESFSHRLSNILNNIKLCSEKITSFLNIPILKSCVKYTKGHYLITSNINPSINGIYTVKSFNYDYINGKNKFILKKTISDLYDEQIEMLPYELIDLFDSRNTITEIENIDNIQSINNNKIYNMESTENKTSSISKSSSKSKSIPNSNLCLDKSTSVTKAFFNKFKEQFVPQIEHNFYVSINNEICCKIDNSIVTIDNDFKLIEYPIKAGIQIPVLSILEKASKINVKDLIILDDGLIAKVKVSIKPEVLLL